MIDWMIRNDEYDDKEKKREIAIDRPIILSCESQDRCAKRKTRKKRERGNWDEESGSQALLFNSNFSFLSYACFFLKRMLVQERKEKLELNKSEEVCDIVWWTEFLDSYTEFTLEKIRYILLYM